MLVSGGIMNNKGFMMAEVVVVSAVILVALSVFYVNYNKLISLYNERLTYYDPATLYSLADFRNKNCLNINNCKVSEIGAGGYSVLSGTGNGTGETTYIVSSLSMFSSSIKARSEGDSAVHNKTFASYLNYLSGSLDSSAKSNYLLIRESCNTDRTNCKYAYLEVLVRA